MVAEIAPAPVGAQVGFLGGQAEIEPIIGLICGGISSRQPNTAQKGLHFPPRLVEGAHPYIQAPADVEGGKIQGQSHQGITQGIGDIFIYLISHLI